MKDFPHVSQELVDALKRSHPENIDFISSLEDLHKAQGRKELIGYLEGIHKSQLSKRK